MNDKVLQDLWISQGLDMNLPTNLSSPVGPAQSFYQDALNEMFRREMERALRQPARMPSYEWFEEGDELFIRRR